MMILKLPYAAMIGALVAFTALIPIVGAFIGAGVGAFLILMESPMKALIFLIFIVVLQQVDGNIIKPLIHGNTSGLSGFWVMFAILFFGGLFGLPGMIVGIPLLSVIYSILRRLIARGLKRKNLPEETGYYLKTHRLPLTDDSGEKSDDTPSAAEERSE
jgi:predicted PurR-regulated permease PerM